MTVTINDLNYVLELVGETPCQNAPSLFFNESENGGTNPNLKFAKRQCESCPALLVCRQYAIDQEEEFGVWGGMSERERLNIIRTKRREASKQRA